MTVPHLGLLRSHFPKRFDSYRWCSSAVAVISMSKVKMSWQRLLHFWVSLERRFLAFNLHLQQVKYVDKSMVRRSRVKYKPFFKAIHAPKNSIKIQPFCPGGVARA